MARVKSSWNRDNLHIGVTPTLWWNDDFLDVDIGVTFGQCVSEMALAGYDGCSVGHKFPTDVSVLTQELKRRRLRVSEPWTSLFFTCEAMYDRTVRDFRTSLAFIKAMHGTDVVVAELGHSSHQQPVALVPNRAVFTDAQWAALSHGLDELGAIAAGEGMRLCYHHHMGTGVQTREEIDRLAASTDPALVYFCFDTGHLLFGGGDPLSMARDHGGRIKHVHLKNIRRPIMERALREQLSFKEAIEAGIFTVPGDPEGCIDFEPIFQALADHHFEGWLVVEAEQDPAHANPLTYATMGREHLRDLIGF